MDFGGDVQKFGDEQQAELTKKLEAALNLKESELVATRHTDTEKYLLTGALGHGKIPHPTKVQLNYKFEGTESIEHGRELEKQVAAGPFKPLTDFPLLRLEMEEIYCTPAPTGAPTVAPSMPVTTTPTEEPTAEPTNVPTFQPTNIEKTQATTLTPTTSTPTVALTYSPVTAEPSDEPTAEPTTAPPPEPTAEPTAEPS